MYSISDMLSDNVILPMEDFISRFNVKTNFLDYNYVIVKIKKYIEWQDLPLHGEELPRNSSLNVFLNLSNKGVSRIYSRMKESFSQVLDNAVEIWTRNIVIDIEGFCLSKSFHYHHLKYKDTHLKYIQFRTLHHRFYTNEKLHKMGICWYNAVFQGLLKLGCRITIYLMLGLSLVIWRMRFALTQ